MPYAEIADGNLFYSLSRAETGYPALVLVHGAGGNRLHWPPELRRLPGATVYALDLPGHGRSDGLGRDTIAGYADAVSAFLSTLDVERAIIVGHSMGGAIAQKLALESPARLTGLVLMATGARLRVAPFILRGICDDFEETVGIITRLAWSPETGPDLIELGRQALLDAGPAVLKKDFVACDRFNVMERLGEISVPTLVIGGTADQLTSVKYAHFLAEHIPSAQCLILEGAGHMVMLERPRQVSTATSRFLRGLR